MTYTSYYIQLSLLLGIIEMYVFKCKKYELNIIVPVLRLFLFASAAHEYSERRKRHQVVVKEGFYVQG